MHQEIFWSGDMAIHKRRPKKIYFPDPLSRMTSLDYRNPRHTMYVRNHMSVVHPPQIISWIAP